MAQDGTRAVPMHLRNAPTRLMKDLGYGEAYRYAHDEPGAFAAGATLSARGVEGAPWYEPVPRGLEIRIGDKLAELRRLNDERLPATEPGASASTDRGPWRCDSRTKGQQTRLLEFPSACLGGGILLNPGSGSQHGRPGGRGVSRMETFFQQVINGLVLGSMYALVALGLHHGLRDHQPHQLRPWRDPDGGALTAWTVITALQGSGLPGWALMLIGLVCAVLVCCVLNFVVEKVAYRPLRNAPRLAPLITAMGMSAAAADAGHDRLEAQPQTLPALLPSDPINPVACHHRPQCLILGLTVVILAACLPGQRHAPGPRDAGHGREPRVAGLMGVKPDFIISATFVIGRPGRRVAA